MKVISMKFIFILTIIALAAVFFWSEDKGPACYQVSDEQARTFVKNDYLQRMTRWDNDVQLLGTEIPKITWEKIERSLTDVEDEKTLPAEIFADLSSIRARGCMEDILLNNLFMIFDRLVQM